MRIVLTAAVSVGLAVLSGPVLADGAYEGSYNAPLQYNWTGIYVGAHGGGAWGGSSDWFFPAVQTTTSSDLGSTGLFGAQLGGLYQWGPLVAGAEASFSALADFGGDATCHPAADCRNDIGDLLLLNGRLGYAWGPALLYATGGYARASIEPHIRFAASAALNESADQRDASGWNVGGGIEYMLARNVTFGVEYIHVNLNHEDLTFTGDASGAFVEQANVDANFNLVRARLSIKLAPITNY
jgi:outer membrane immunogenic protein